MKVLSTAYFPPINYCSVLKNEDEIILDLGEHFVKQSIRNRSYVLGPNSILKLIVPLQKWKNNSPVKDIRIAYSENWQKIHWKTIEASYRSSPYFEYYEDKFDQIINQSKFDYLIDLNRQTIELTKDLLGLKTEIHESLSYIDEVEKEKDLRKSLDYKSKQSDVNSSYFQVFGQNEFHANLSFLDLICNEGPNAIHLL